MAVYFLKTPRSNSNAPKFSSSPSPSLSFPSTITLPLPKGQEMSQRDQKNYEERVYGRRPAQEQDDEYDVYLFWPTLSSHNVSSRDTPSSPLHEPVSLRSESTDFDYSEFSSGPPSPITFAPTLDCRYQMEVDFSAASPDTPEAEAGVPKTSELAKISPIVNIRMICSQVAQLLDRAIDGVKFRIRKPKSQAP